MHREEEESAGGERTSRYVSSMGLESSDLTAEAAAEAEEPCLRVVAEELFWGRSDVLEPKQRWEVGLGGKAAAAVLLRPPLLEAE